MVEENTQEAPQNVEQPQVSQAVDPDFSERAEGFQKEVTPIFAKYELGLASRAKLTPDGRVTSEVVLVSTRQPDETKKPKGEAKQEAPAPTQAIDPEA